MPAKPDDAASPPAAQIVWTVLHASTSLNLKTGQAKCSFNLQGNARTEGDSTIVAIAHPIRVTQITDDQGNDLRQPQHLVLPQQQRFSLVRHGAQSDTQPIPVSITVGNLDRIPNQLTEVAGELRVMVADESLVRTIETVEAGVLTELAPGVTIEIEKVEADAANRVNVHFKYESTRGDVFNAFQPGEPLVTAIKGFDADGQPLRQWGTSRSSRRQEDEILIGTGVHTFLAEPDTPLTQITVGVVLKTREQVVPFAMHNVMLPGRDRTEP